MALDANMVDDVAEGSRRSLVRRCARGVAAGLATLALVAVPLGIALSTSWGYFTGCQMACPIEPRPGEGVAWALVSALVLAIPLTVGLRVARVTSRAAWVAAAALLPVLLAALTWAMFVTSSLPMG